MSGCGDLFVSDAPRVWQEDGAAAAMEAAKRSLEMHGAGMYGVQGLSSAMHLPVRLQA